MRNLNSFLDPVIKTYRLCVKMLFQPMDELHHLNVICHGLLEPVASFSLFPLDLMP